VQQPGPGRLEGLWGLGVGGQGGLEGLGSGVVVGGGESPAAGDQGGRPRRGGWGDVGSSRCATIQSA